MKKLFLLMTVLLVAACAEVYKPQIFEDKPKPRQFVNEDDIIALQNLNNRVVVYCLKDDTQSPEKCAKTFENKGFVRIKNIPYKVAKYDFLQKDTYPTRRWRDGEITPRW